MDSSTDEYPPRWLFIALALCVVPVVGGTLGYTVGAHFFGTREDPYFEMGVKRALERIRWEIEAGDHSTVIQKIEGKFEYGKPADPQSISDLC